MGLFGNLFGGNSESREEVEQRIQNSECGQLVARVFCELFSPGGEPFAWLMANSKERMYQLDVFKNGIKLTQIEVNQRRLKETGTYNVDYEGWSFGASEYADLPNNQYVNVFREFLVSEIAQNCPAVRIIDGKNIMLNESVKKGW